MNTEIIVPERHEETPLVPKSKEIPIQDDEAALVDKLEGMLRLERSSPFDMLISLARVRSQWIDDNVPRHRQLDLWAKALARIEKR